MKKYFRITFQKVNGVYCENIAHADSIDDVAVRYSKYPWHKATLAESWEVDTARRKGMPIVEI